MSARIPDSGEAIGRVVADMRRGNFRYQKHHRDQAQISRLIAQDGKTVDATAIYHSLLRKNQPIDLYNDHCIAPPWELAVICYQNEYGNVIAMPQFSREINHVDPPPWDNETDPIDWTTVKWQIDTLVWCGGRSLTVGPMPLMGPLMWWQFAVREDGAPVDLHWIHATPEYPRENWDMTHLVLLGALNFLNCRNIELVEPRRPRTEQRRIERTGVRVHEINVFPVGHARGCSTAGVIGGGTPLTSVRGHFATYGGERGLLFGKYAGRYWRPQHARGSTEHGEVEQSFVLRAD